MSEATDPLREARQRDDLLLRLLDARLKPLDALPEKIDHLLMRRAQNEAEIRALQDDHASTKDRVGTLEGKLEGVGKKSAVNTATVETAKAGALVVVGAWLAGFFT